MVTGETTLRSNLPRNRNPTSTTVYSSSIQESSPKLGKIFQGLGDDPFAFLDEILAFIAENISDRIADSGETETQDEIDILEEILESLTGNSGSTMSMATSSPSAQPTEIFSNVPSLRPSSGPSFTPSLSPLATPPSVITDSPVSSDSVSPPSSIEFDTVCAGITVQQREQQILAILKAVVDPSVDLLDNSTSQGQATTWLLSMDQFRICPDNKKLIQRWTLAVTYFSTGGNNWDECSANPMATDMCGMFAPFMGSDRFLSAGSECNWAGIDCDSNNCVTAIDYGE